MTTFDQPSVEHLLVVAGRLDRDEQLRLMEGLRRLLQRAQNDPSSITALRGLGREVWEGVDATDYVRRERASWGG